MPMVAMLNIGGIDLEPTGDKPWLPHRNWIAYTFYVKGPGDIRRQELGKMIGKKLYGKTIRGVESFAVEHQTGKLISLAVKGH